MHERIRFFLLDVFPYVLKFPPHMMMLTRSRMPFELEVNFNPTEAASTHNRGFRLFFDQQLCQKQSLINTLKATKFVDLRYFLMSKTKYKKCKWMQMQFCFQHKVSVRSVFAYDHTLQFFLAPYHLISSLSLDVASPYHHLINSIIAVLNRRIRSSNVFFLEDVTFITKSGSALSCRNVKRQKIGSFVSYLYLNPFSFTFNNQKIAFSKFNFTFVLQLEKRATCLEGKCELVVQIQIYIPQIQIQIYFPPFLKNLREQFESKA